MPTGGTPIDPELTLTVFNALKAMTYDSTAMAFRDAGDNLHYMFIERKPNTVATGQWFYATDAEGGVNPRGQIPQLTFDVIKYGSLDTQTQKITYSAKDYRIRIYRDVAAGKQLAKACSV